MTEKWIKIEGFDYEVSDQGNVRNIKTGKERKPQLVKGYLRVILTKDGKQFPYQIHRLVASAFIPNPENKPQVNHIDCNKQNNNVGNLEWSTREENMQHAYAHGLMHQNPRYSGDNPLSKKVAMMDLNKNIIRVFESTRDVYRELGYFCSNISNVCNGKGKTCHGYLWKYI